MSNMCGLFHVSALWHLRLARAVINLFKGGVLRKTILIAISLRFAPGGVSESSEQLSVHLGDCD